MNPSPPPPLLPQKHPMKPKKHSFFRIALCALALGLLAGCSGGSGGYSSIEELRQAAEKGDADAQFNLGDRYAKGKGVSKTTPNRGTLTRKPPWALC